MQKIFRWYTLCIVILLFAVLFITLTGCSKEADNSGVSLSLWTQEGESEGVYDWINTLATRFMKDNPTVTIEVVAKDTEALREDFQTASLAGDAPDLLWTVNDHAGPFIAAGIIEPVGDLFDSSKFIESVQADGNIYGVPISSGNHLMLMYNKSLVAIPPDNTNTMLELAQALTFGEQYGFVYNQTEPFWLVPWLGGFNGKVFATDGVTPTLNTPAMVSTLSFLYDIKYTYQIIPQESDYATMDTLFKEGKAAMIVNGDWSISDYSSVLGNDFAVAPLPKISETGAFPAPYTSGKYFMVASGISDAVRVAVKNFIAYVTSEEIQTEMLTEFKRLPALLSVLSSDAVQKEDPLLKSSAAQLQYGTPMPSVIEMRAIWDAMKPEMNVVLSGAKSPADAARDMQAAAEVGIQALQ